VHFIHGSLCSIQVLSEDELIKLKEEAPKYKDLVSKPHCIRTYEEISKAHQVRAEKRRLLGFLVKEAKAACEKGKLHGESEQIPQEHVMFANLCRMILPLISALKPPYVHEFPLPKGLKRSWDSAFEPLVQNKSTFCEGLSVGETGGTRIARRFSFSGAQPSTSKAIVPYKPIPHVLLSILAESQKIDVDNMDRDQYTNLGKSVLAPLTTTEQVEVGIEATPLASVGDSKDEAKLLVEHSEQVQVQVQANSVSGLPPSPRPPKSVSKPSSPF